MGVPICSTEMPAGRPKGTWGPKRRQLDADEADPDGSSRANKKANFFKSQIYDPHRCPPSTDSELSGHTPDVGMCDSVSETSVNTGALTTNTPILSASEVSDDVPDLPKRRDDRQDNTLYMYKGRLVRYQASGHAILCTCNGTSSCAGNVRLHECERRQESAHTEPVASRSKNNCDYKMMHSGTGLHVFMQDQVAAAASQVYDGFIEACISAGQRSCAFGIRVADWGGVSVQGGV